MSLLNQLKTLFQEAVDNIYASEDSIVDKSVEITLATQKKFGHYQCNSALKFAKALKQNPRDVATKIIAEIEAVNSGNIAIDKLEIAGPGFINITLSNLEIIKTLMVNTNDFRLGVQENMAGKKVVVDYSSPNVAKEMHVGHLRSTIIGESIARLLEFVGYTVSRVNHIGDWGTQFGMLISFIETEHPEYLENKINLDLSGLVEIYRAAKAKFDTDEQFKEQSQKAVVRLQSGDEKTLDVWKQICTISEHGYQKIYDLLDVKDLQVKGESFYNPMLAEVVNNLESKDLVVTSDGAKCIYLPGFINRDGDPLPLIIQKSDGGYNYATTDLAAIKHRVQEEDNDWVIYVVDAGQSNYFDMVFMAAEKVGFAHPENTKLTHVPFGLVLREDGKKFKTRSGDTEKLIDLLKTAIQESKDILLSRNQEADPNEVESDAKVLGINAVKYADLSCNRTSNYKFSYKKMLQFEGNTAAFLNYAYVRTQSIMRKIDFDESKLIAEHVPKLSEESELDLAFHITQFPDVINNAVNDLMPNRICDYLFKLAELFHSFFHHCRVEGTEQEKDRLYLCLSTAKIMEKGFYLLGLTPLSKM